ncbi:unnamed protein product [Adineta steineri]|uniref:TIR domain-containing protein n=1 Tax=Adineta steineri TaxID=433720 RepID=A0A814EIL2_9BILA|nr:unnamed protein product [Adineta steineri]
MSSEHGLHVMLSYHWDNKELVSKIYKVLKSRNIPVWMDIHGGISFNLFQSMADGVENAAVVVCFMTQKYQNSRNCEKELLYAERRRVSIIPCRLTRDWEPSTWLGIVIAGLVWVDFREITEANVDVKIDKLIDQIRVVAGKQLNCFLPETPSVEQTHPICVNNSSNTLYPVLSISSEISNRNTSDLNNLVRASSIDSTKRSTNLISRQHQSIDHTYNTPPPVPPRPNKDLIRERLSHTDTTKTFNKSESIDEKKENSIPVSNGRPDICEVSVQNQSNPRSIPDVIDLSPSINNSEKKRSGIIIDYSKFRRPPRIIGDDNDEISFCCPSGVAVSKTGLIYVADQQNQCIKIIPLLGSGKQILSRPFNRPKGVHIDELGRVLVTEHNRLLILDNDLNLLKAIGDHGSKPGEFNVPWGVTTDSSSNIYVCDQMNNRIQKLDVDGRFLLEWGYEGEHPGQFYYPHFISVSGNRVAVSDQLNHRVQVFDCFGNYHYKLGEPGNEPGQFSCPFGVCIDANGHLVVADHDNNRVQMFDENGDIELILDRETNPLFDFQGVHGLALTHDGGLLITDYKRNGKHRLFIFA